MKNKGKFATFLAKKDVVISFERYLIDALSYMALGLFATLITGVIFETVGGSLNIHYFVEILAPKAKAMAGPGINEFMIGLGVVINRATELQPIPMGMIVAAIMGISLTLPISSTAIAIMIAIGGPASGAAVVGGCAHSVGFGIQSLRENGWGGFVSQALGSPMVQIGNIMKKPILMVPPTITAIILGPLVTTIFKMESISAAAGTGTSGFVAPLGALSAMPEAGYPAGEIWLKIAMFCFIAPAALTWIISEVFRKFGWIKEGDLKLDI